MLGNEYSSWGGMFSIICGDGANGSFRVSTGNVNRLLIAKGGDYTCTVDSIFRVTGSSNVKINLNSASATGATWLEYEKETVDQWLVGTESSETDFQWYWNPSSAGTKMRLTNAGNLTVAGNITATSSNIVAGNSVEATGDIITDGIYRVNSAPDTDVIVFDQSGRKNAIKTYFQRVLIPVTLC